MNNRLDPISPLTPEEARRSAQQLLDGGDPGAAAVVVKAALQRYRTDAALHALLGQVQQARGDMPAAADALRAALKLQPNWADAHTALAQTLRALGDGDGATLHFECACEFDPGHAQRRLMLHLHRGNLHDERGETEAAAAAFLAATEQFPQSADAWAMLGVMQHALGNAEGAQNALGRALQLAPERLPVMEHFANVLMSQKKFEDAAMVYERMFQIEPKRPLVAGWLLHTKYLLGDWLNLAPLQRYVEGELQAGRPGAEPFGLQGWCADPALLHRAAVAQAARKHPARPDLLPRPVPGQHARLRLGYVAGEFREQATSVLLTEVLERHDRERFEIFAFDNGWDDGSERRRRIEAACRIVPIRGLSDVDAARRVREHGIDVLVNLNGYFGLARTGLFSLRAAAVQANYLGFPGTIGAPYIDYLIADRHVIPEAERVHYTEHVVYLPDSYQPNDSTRAIAERPLTRADVGLPEGAFVFCCLNNAYKILPPLFALWMRLLQRVPGSVLMLYGDKPEMQANLRHEAQQCGVAPERIVFAAPWKNADHLRRLQLCDLFLDTWPYNAHTTGSDALWAGLPVLTCTGRSFPSRVGASLLHAVGLPELITEDFGSYEALALRLATEPGLLLALREQLARQVRASRLYDTARYTRHLEAAFEQMVARVRSGLQPEGFAVAALA